MRTDLGAVPARYHRAFNDRDFDVWREVFDEDVELLIGGTSLHGVDAAVGYGVGRVARFPGLYIAAERIVSQSEDTIVTEIDLVAGDPAGGHPRPTGTTCEICRVRDGRIVSCRSYFVPEPADRADGVRVPARGEAGVVADEQAALQRVATLVARGVSQEELFAAVTEEAGWLVAADTTSLMRFDPDDTVTLVATWSARQVDLPIGASRPVSEKLRSMRDTGRPSRWGPAELPLTGAFVEEARALDMRMFVVVPIMVDGRVWGVAFACSTADQPFADDAEARLAGFTELVATAIANAQARVELRGFAEEQAALRRVATLVAEAAAPQEMFAAVTAEVGGVLSADVTVLSRYDPDGKVTVVGAWSSTGDAGRSLVGRRFDPGGQNVHTVVFQTHRPARVDRAQASGPAADVFRVLGVRSAVGAPISVEGRLWGIMIVLSTRTEFLPANTEARLAGFTELVATALANTQARTELRGFAEEQAALRRVATLVARGAPPEEIFSAVAAEVGRLLEVDFTEMSRYDPDGAQTIVGACTSTGAALPLPVDHRWRLGGRDVVSLVFQTGRPARTDDYADGSGPGAGVARTWGVRASVGVPIMVEGRLWGAMMVASARAEPLPTDTEARLAGFTELVGTAIANAEAQAALTASRARIVAAADTARGRIERDLHDGAQQRLVSLALQLRTMQASPPVVAGELTQQLGDVADGLRGALEELREIARGLHPAILAEGGLRPALKTLARRSVVPVRLDIDLDRRLPEPIEIAAHYVVSEALTNAAKHAGATVIDVKVAAYAGMLRVCVRDNGRGGADVTRGTGLVGLTDRVEALNGRLSLHSPPGAGTTMNVALPLTIAGSPGSPAAVAGQPDSTGRDPATDQQPPDRGRN